MLARNPRGGSLVILIPFCRMVTGNAGEGMEVSHRRKFSSAESSVMPSQIFSRLGIQLGARWQFCRSTHLPASVASAMSAAAFGPWPWPMEMTEMASAFSMSSANLSSAEVGSEPGESTNRSGVAQLDSANEPGKSNGGGSTNRRPIVRSTKSFTAGVTLSGRRHRIRSKT